MDKRRIAIGGAIVVVVILSLGLYLNRAQTGGNGTILLTGVPEGATVFLDNKREQRVDHAGQSVVLNGLSVGTHTVVVAKDGYWPWSKKLVVANKEHISVSSFVIAQEPSKTILDAKDDRYNDIQSALKQTTLPSEGQPLISADNTTKLWTQDNAIMAEWVAEREPSAPFCITGTCQNKLLVLPADLPIRNLAFLPGRNDVVVFAAQNGIFALELDKRGTQNFEPIYLGTTPQFTTLTGNTLAVKDGEVTFLIHF